MSHAIFAYAGTSVHEKRRLSGRWAASEKRHPGRLGISARRISWPTVREKKTAPRQSLAGRGRYREDSIAVRTCWAEPLCGTP